MTKKTELSKLYTDQLIKLGDGDYYVPSPRGRTTQVRFDLETEVFDVYCRRNNDGTCVLEIESSGEIRVYPITREVLMVEPVPIGNR